MFNDAPDPQEKSASISTELASIPMEQLVQEVYASSAPQARGRILAKLVGKVYETAPVPVKTRLLEQLLRPLGILSLVAVANGVFAKIRLHSAWPGVPLNPADVQHVRPDDVVALASRLLQLSNEALNGVAQLLTDAPSLASSSAAAVLVVLLLHNAHNRRADDQDLGSP